MSEKKKDLDQDQDLGLDEKDQEEILHEEDDFQEEEIDREVGDESSQEDQGEEDDYDRLKLSMVRLQADFENYKRRTALNGAKQFEAGKIDVAEDLIPVIDNLERAIDSMEDQGMDSENIKGVSLIEDQFREVLKKNGIEEIEALDLPFDPNYHHAVAMVETDECEPNTVVDVLQKGYKINETIIRPSMVRVSK